MRNPWSFFATTILLLGFYAASPAETSLSDLDAVARQAVAQSHVAGASVLVARGDHILLLKGYGVSDIGLEAPSRPDSVYHIVGPMLPFTGVAVMLDVTLAAHHKEYAMNEMSQNQQSQKTRYCWMGALLLFVGLEAIIVYSQLRDHRFAAWTPHFFYLPIMLTLPFSAVSPLYFNAKSGKYGAISETERSRYPLSFPLQFSWHM